MKKAEEYMINTQNNHGLKYPKLLLLLLIILNSSDSSQTNLNESEQSDHRKQNG